MDKRAETRLHPAIQHGHRRMREALGLRPETRLDEIIFADGTVVHEMPNGVFVCVRGTMTGVYGR